ncbi:MAG: NUDIX hydrolase [Gemmatimonadetes bacterium]|nr:NUDIX hydrolase [Gemmatimonadota bacterium]
MKKWQTLSRETVFTNPWYSFRHDRYVLPDGTPGDYHYIHTHGAVMIVPVHENGTLALVKQYRYLLGRESIEFPAGGVPAGESPEDHARQELAEESGLSAAEWKRLGSFASWNGATNEECTVFEARGFTPVDAEQDASEEIERLTVSPAAFEEWIRSGRIDDGMTLAAFLIWRSATGRR